jgi:hypothetical protein
MSPYYVLNSVITLIQMGCKNTKDTVEKKLVTSDNDSEKRIHDSENTITLAGKEYIATIKIDRSIVTVETDRGIMSKGDNDMFIIFTISGDGKEYILKEMMFNVDIEGTQNTLKSKNLKYLVKIEEHQMSLTILVWDYKKKFILERTKLTN